MKNENQVDLVTLRNDVAESVVRAYGAERAYAKSLTVHFGFSWYDVEASDTTETAKTVTAESSNCIACLKGLNIRTRQPYGREYASMGVKKLKGNQTLKEDQTLKGRATVRVIVRVAQCCATSKN